MCFEKVKKKVRQHKKGIIAMCLRYFSANNAWLWLFSTQQSEIQRGLEPFYRSI